MLSGPCTFMSWIEQERAMDLLAVVSVMVLSVSLGLAAAGGCLALIFYVMSRAAWLGSDSRARTMRTVTSASATPGALSRKFSAAAVPAGR